MMCYALCGEAVFCSMTMIIWNSETTFMLTMAYHTPELCVKLSVEDHVKRCLVVCVDPAWTIHFRYQSFSTVHHSTSRLFWACLCNTCNV